MSGRYTLGTLPQALAEHFALDAVPDGLGARYNIAPGQEVPVITAIEGRGRHLDHMRWGLVPAWANAPSIGRRLYNLRAETVAGKRAFRAAFLRHRCLLPADGFYEWEPADGRKTPYWIGRPDRQPMGLAGLWERWEDPETGEVIDSCALLTCRASPDVAPIHPRMPVIIPPESYAEWLSQGTDPQRLQALMAPYPGRLVAHRVDTAVNNPRNDYDALTRSVVP